MKNVFIILLSLTVSQISYADSNSCALFFKPETKVNLTKVDSKKELVIPHQVKNDSVNLQDTWTQEAAWKESQNTITQIGKIVKGKDYIIHGLLTAMLAKEFVWLNGDPGGAKTLVSRIMFQAQLNAIPNKEKKIFILQFHKLMSEGIITGFPKIKALLDEGKYEVETSSSLVGDRFLYLIADEAEKSNPATLTALLGVLNERKAFLGSKVVDAALSSGVFTSNKTTAEFLQAGREHRPGLEALLDRMAIKNHVPNMQPTPEELVKLYDALKTGSTNDLKKLRLPIVTLQSLVSKVEIPSTMIDELAKLIQNMDALTTAQADQSLAAVRAGDRGAQEYFPANQFSNRSALKLLNVMKASFIAEQLIDGKDINHLELKMTQKDLYHVARSAIYGGPSEIRLKHYTLEEFKITDELANIPYKPRFAEWNPYERILTVNHNFTDERHNIYIDKDAQSIERADIGITIPKAQLDKIKELIAKAEQENNFNPDVIVYETDAELNRLLANRAIPTRTRKELETILSDTNALVQQLNALQRSDNEVVNKKLENAKVEISKFANKQKKWDRYLELVLKSTTLSPEKKLKAYYNATQFAMKSLRLSFPEMNHSIMAHLVSILSGQHAFVFGPPGGAKTALAKQILSAALKWENMKRPKYTDGQLDKFESDFKADLKKRSPDAYELFFLQFHPMIPEGNIIGFAKLQSQIDSGKLEMDYSTSLAHERFIFAILDEVEKGNPAVLASLLSILNEREVFIGQDSIKSSLRTAILTSNKMPSEYLDGFLEDRPTGVALQDRSMNKVYVSNKFSTAGALGQFLLQHEAGLKSELSMSLPLNELKPLVDKVEFDEYTKITMAKVINEFVSKRLAAEEDSKTRHEEDYVAYPDYYIRPSQNSDRSNNQLFDQFKAHFILDQVQKGVQLKDLRYKVEISDLYLLIGGLGYWGPYEFKPTYNSDGILSFEYTDETLAQLKNSAYVNQRNKYMLEQIHEEGREFKDILNAEVYELLKTYRETIAQYPNLFPTLFANDAERKAFIEKNKDKK
jgi:MoxR-like ATPase